MVLLPWVPQPPWMPHVPWLPQLPWVPPARLGAAAAEPAQHQGSLQRATGPFPVGTGWTKRCCVPQCPALCQAVRWQGLAVPGAGDAGGLGGLWAVAGQEQGGPPCGDPCPFLAHPDSHPLACPQVGCGGNTTCASWWPSAPHICGTQLLTPPSTSPCLSFPLQGRVAENYPTATGNQQGPACSTGSAQQRVRTHCKVIWIDL